jgi:hypothetical protein
MRIGVTFVTTEWLWTFPGTSDELVAMLPRSTTVRRVFRYPFVVPPSDEGTMKAGPPGPVDARLTLERSLERRWLILEHAGLRRELDFVAEPSRGEALMDAVSAYDVKEVERCLAAGADPNHREFDDRDEPNGYLQPTTPLRMVMFRISDALLDERGLEQFAEVARVLVAHGADPMPAMQIAESRYGKFDPDCPRNLFTDVWRIIANAAGR